MYVTLHQYVPLVVAVMAKYFPAVGGNSAAYCNRPDEYNRIVSKSSELLSADLIAQLDDTGRQPTEGDVKYVFLTRCGPGPIQQPAEEALLDANTGLPREPGPKHKRMKLSHC